MIEENQDDLNLSPEQSSIPRIGRREVDFMIPDELFEDFSNRIKKLHEEQLEAAGVFHVTCSIRRGVPCIRLTGTFSKESMDAFRSIVDANDNDPGISNAYILNVSTVRVAPSDVRLFLKTLEKCCFMFGQTAPGAVVVLPTSIPEKKRREARITYAGNVWEAVESIRNWQTHF